MTSSGLVARLRAAGCVFAEEEAHLLSLEAQSPEHLERLVLQRIGGLPLEHVLGWVEFCGDRYALGPSVFVPRPRTAALVRRAVTIAPASATIVDLCCGCGAVGAAVARRVSGSRLYASDVDEEAVRWANRNLLPLGGEAVVGDLYSGIPSELMGAVDIITIVAPYVPTAEIDLLPHEARDFEPLVALDGGADGLEVLRRAIGQAREWLAPSGALVAEIAEDQAPSIRSFAQEQGFAAAASTDDDGATVAVIARQR